MKNAIFTSDAKGNIKSDAGVQGLTFESVWQGKPEA